MQSSRMMSYTMNSRGGGGDGGGGGGGGNGGGGRVTRPAVGQGDVLGGDDPGEGGFDVFYEPLEAVVERGRHFLDRIELAEAEELFREVLQRLSSAKTTINNSRLAVESLFGLGEIYSRLSRQIKHSETEWLRRMFHSLLLYSEAMDISRRTAEDIRFGIEEEKAAAEAEANAPGTTRSKLFSDTVGMTTSNLTYFKQIAGRAGIQVKLAEECLLNEIKMNVMKHCCTQQKGIIESLVGACVLRDSGGLVDNRFGIKEYGLPGTMISEPGTIYPSSKSRTYFDGSWLYDTLMTSVKNPVEPKQDETNLALKGKSRHQICIETETESTTSGRNAQEDDGGLQSLLVQQTKRTINFAMVQEAIRRLVSQVSTDVWSKYDTAYRRVPRALIENRLSSEIVMRLSPGSQDSQDLVSALEEAILFEDESEYLEFQSLTDGSMNGDFDESRASFMLDSCWGDSEQYESGSEDESSYETFTVKVFPCATHTSNKRNIANSRNDSTSNFSTISNRSNGSRTDGGSQINAEQGPSKEDSNFLSPSSAGVMRGSSSQNSLRPQSANDTQSRSASSSGPPDPGGNLRRNTSQGSTMHLGGKSGATISNEAHQQTQQSNSEQKNCPGQISLSEIISGLDAFGRLLHGVLSSWRATNDKKPEIAQAKHFALHSIEELSPLTEKDRSLQCIEAGKELVFNAEIGESRYLNEGKLCQTVARVAAKVGESLDAEGLTTEACEIFKYALGVFLEYPTEENRIDLFCDLILSIGTTKCRAGETSSGVQLLDECVALYGGRITATGPANTARERRDMYKVSEILFRQGNAIVADSYRQDLLMARVMLLAKQESLGENKAVPSSAASDVSEADDKNDEDDDEEEGDGYSVCCLEAIACYKKALSLLERLRRRSAGEDTAMPPLLAQLYIGVSCNLADCYVISGYIDRALELYEQTLQLFQNSSGGNPSLLAQNSHVLAMIGTINFLSRNWVRAATMYETSHILRQHLKGIPDDPTLEMPWSLCMLSLSYYMLGHYHRCVVWSIRAFTLYVRLYGGRILDVDPLGHWFIVQTLYMLGYAYLSLNFNEKALPYLTLCKNMATRSSSGQEDNRQVISVLTTLADTYSALKDRDSATKYYHQALDCSQTLGDKELISSIHSHMYGGYDALRDKKSAAEDEKRLESSIKDDMVNLLQKLGVENTLSCDIDKAIGCYAQCVQAFSNDIDVNFESGDIDATMASMGTLCQVKGCLKNDEAQAASCLQQAERYFKEAMSMSSTFTSPVCVQYANYKFKQGDSAGALLTMLPFVFCNRPASIEVAYHGIEQAALPMHLHHMTNETVVMEARAFAQFLAILCYKSLGLSRDAEQALVRLFGSASSSQRSSNHTLLGYGCLELGLMEEAVEAFYEAAILGGSEQSAMEYWMSVVLCVCLKISRILEDLNGVIGCDESFISDCYAKAERIRKRRKAQEVRKKHREKTQMPTGPSFTQRMEAIKSRGKVMAGLTDGQNDLSESFSKSDLHDEASYMTDQTPLDDNEVFEAPPDLLQTPNHISSRYTRFEPPPDLLLTPTPSSSRYAKLSSKYTPSASSTYTPPTSAYGHAPMSPQQSPMSPGFSPMSPSYAALSSAYAALPSIHEPAGLAYAPRSVTETPLSLTKTSSRYTSMPSGSSGYVPLSGSPYVPTNPFAPVNNRIELNNPELLNKGVDSNAGNKPVISATERAAQLGDRMSRIGNALQSRLGPTVPSGSRVGPAAASPLLRYSRESLHSASNSNH